MDIKSKVFVFLIGIFSPQAVTSLCAALPIFELRLAIPLAILKFSLPLHQAYFLALIGNIIPVIPLLFLWKYCFHVLEEIPGIGPFLQWWFRSVHRRSKIVERWGFWGLVFFVAIPLPITGAWTGSVAATLFQIPIKKATLAITMGVAIAGMVMTTLSVMARETISTWLVFS